MITETQLPHEAEVVERTAETPSIFTLQLRLTDEAARRAYAFSPGQFNMLYLHGVGEVPISISSDPAQPAKLSHTIRALGRVTHGLEALSTGERLGLRGPFGTAWPLAQAAGRDLVIITGGLGCAPSVSAIEYAMRRRDSFGRITILQGVKHSDDMFWRERYARWDAQPDTEVHLAADVAGHDWRGHVGRVTELLDRVTADAANTTAMLCGPEIMMRKGVEGLLERGLHEADIWISLERNMHCAVGQCGHCQIGPHFACRDGPVFAYPQIRQFFGVRGF